MHLWEFNQYVMGKQEKLREKEKDIIKIAYYTAYFNNSKKTKSLKHYLKEIDNNGKTNKRNNDKLEYAKRMCEKISNIQE